MDYNQLKAVLGQETVSRIEDAVLMALADTRGRPPEVEAALRQLLMAMVGAVILNRTDCRAEVADLAEECSASLNQALQLVASPRSRSPVH